MNNNPQTLQQAIVHFSDKDVAHQYFDKFNDLMKKLIKVPPKEVEKPKKKRKKKKR